MSKTYYASYNKPGRPISVTFHNEATEDAFKERAAELGLTMQQLVDRVLNEEDGSSFS